MEECILQSKAKYIERALHITFEQFSLVENIRNNEVSVLSLSKMYFMRYFSKTCTSLFYIPYQITRFAESSQN